MVKDINPGSGGSIVKDDNAYPFESKFAAVGNRLYFACDDGSGKGEELCTSDGTASGTMMIRDINPGAASGFRRDNEPRAGIAVGDQYLFRAFNGYNDQLWISGGCDKNTYNLRIINQGPANIRNFATSPNIPGKAFFYASQLGPQDDELWVSDGTTAGTKVAVEACTAAGCGGAWQSLDIGFVGSKVVFPARSVGPGTGDSAPNELWSYDPNTNTGGKITQLSSSAPPEGFARGFASTDSSTTYFAAADGTAKLNRVWRTDGTSVQKLSNTVDNVVPPLVASGNRVFFQALDQTYGNELHMATTSSAQLVKNLVPGYVHGWAEEITDMGGYILFSGDKELYRSDGTDAGTYLVKDINAGTSVGGGPGQSYPKHFLKIAPGLLIFSGDDGVHGREVWTSDGTSAGTKMLMDIAPGNANSNPSDFTMVGTAVYFSANDGVNGRELWKYDPSNSVSYSPVRCPVEQIQTPTNTDGLPGACCTAVGSCERMILSACTAKAGNAAAFLGIGTDCATNGVMCNGPKPAPGVCCQSGGFCAINHTPTSCTNAKGMFYDGTDCTKCYGAPPTNAGDPIGVCCSGTSCLQQSTMKTCTGTFKQGALCSACFGDGSGATDPPSADGSCCKGTGGSATCYQGHTPTSCSDFGGRFLTGQQCSACFVEDSVVKDGCTADQIKFCESRCGGAAKVAKCACNGINASLTCVGNDTPTPNQPTAAPPSATTKTLPPNASTYTITVVGQPGTFTGAYVPNTNAQGVVQTESNGKTITDRLEPKTNANGQVPTNANGGAAETVKVVPQTDSNNNINTMGGTTAVVINTDTKPYVPSPTPYNGSSNGCSASQLNDCKELCTYGVKSCSCNGSSLDVMCLDKSAETNQMSLTPSSSSSLVVSLATMSAILVVSSL